MLWSRGIRFQPQYKWSTVFIFKSIKFFLFIHTKNKLTKSTEQGPSLIDNKLGGLRVLGKPPQTDHNPWNPLCEFRKVYLKNLSVPSVPLYVLLSRHVLTRNRPSQKITRRNGNAVIIAHLRTVTAIADLPRTAIRVPCRNLAGDSSFPQHFLNGQEVCFRHKK